MPEKGIRSTYSQCPLQLLLYDELGLIGTGTAFLYEINSRLFLVTNWHNVSGRHFLNGQPLTSPPRFPTHLGAKLMSNVGNQQQMAAVSYALDIYDDSGPLWLEHPTMGSRCDVVALPFSRPSACASGMHHPANLISDTRIPVEPGGTVFVIGFPKSISVSSGLPVWKSGYIASEPHYDVTVGGDISEIGGLASGTLLPAFFIDSLTRPGMSGAPVFASFTGAWDTKDPYAGLQFDQPGFWQRTDVILGGSAKEFVGCYSGRIAAKEEEAALGLCWRKEVIDIICSSGVRGKQLDNG